MIKTLLHFDSIDGEMNYDTILKTNHCYNTVLKINKAYINIKEISLKSIEIPLFFNNIRNSNSSTLFSINFNYLTYENISLGITIPEDTHLSISTLLQWLNATIPNALSPYEGLSIVVSVYSGWFLQIEHNCTSLTLNKCLLINNILGFNTGTYTTSPIISTNFYCLNIDNYLTMYITNLSGADSTNVNGRLLSFKIILPQTNGNILYLGESNTFIQTISITDPKFVLTSMNIMILDRFGFPINGGNAHYSFTLGIVCDNPKEIRYR
jgi:hypothetical protein